MKIALFPGGYKPPHLGHYNAAKYLADKADKVIIRIGSKPRNNIGKELSNEIWHLYKEFDPDPRAKKLIISIAQSNSPVTDVYEFVENIVPENSEVILALGEKDMSDGRYNNIPQIAEPRNIKSQIEFIPPQAGGISGTDIRQIIKFNNKEEFFKYIPDFLPEEIKEEIWTKLVDTQQIEEFMMGTMNKQEMARHNKNMKSLKKYLNKQGDQMIPVPTNLTSGLKRKLYEDDPKVGTGKKPKGSGRRLYTDENPKDTIRVKFSSKQDIIDTLNKSSFKSKSHARQSQVINLIHQRVRAAYNRSKDPETKSRLKTALDYAEQRKEASKEKTKRMKKESFSKNWWLNILNEGGAAGHMAHPFDLPNVNTGQDLVNVFNQAAQSLNKKSGSVKIDGINSSIRLVNLDGKPQFVLDRGSKKALDLRGVTKQDLVDRFGEGHGMIKIGGNVLDIFNSALPSIQNELKSLGMLDNPNIMINMEYVSGQTNVQEYNKNFLALHGLLEISMDNNKRIIREKNYNPQVMSKLIQKLESFAKDKGFEVYGDVPTTLTKSPDFKSALNTKYTIEFSDRKETKTLSQWLSEINSIPKTERLKMNVNGSVKDVGALSKQVYFEIFGGKNVDDLFDSEQELETAIKGATIYLATEKLGDEVLNVLNSPMGSVNNHEGVVIRDSDIYNKPFKITGKFITGGVSSQFQKK
jgi:phosphopantetheine adenylyltransferase